MQYSIYSKKIKTEGIARGMEVGEFELEAQKRGKKEEKVPRRKARGFY